MDCEYHFQLTERARRDVRETVNYIRNELDNEKAAKTLLGDINKCMEKVCAYTVLETMELFDMDNPFAYGVFHVALEDDPDFCLRIASPKDKKVLKYQTADVTERFFMESRVKDLKGVDENETP